MPGGEVFVRWSLALGGNIVSPEGKSFIKTTKGIYPLAYVYYNYFGETVNSMISFDFSDVFTAIFPPPSPSLIRASPFFHYFLQIICPLPFPSLLLPDPRNAFFICLFLVDFPVFCLFVCLW